MERRVDRSRRDRRAVLDREILNRHIFGPKQSRIHLRGRRLRHYNPTMGLLLVTNIALRRGVHKGVRGTARLPVNSLKSRQVRQCHGIRVF